MEFWGNHGVFMLQYLTHCILRRPVIAGAFATGRPTLPVVVVNQVLSVQS